MPSPATVTYARKTFGSPSFESHGKRLSLFLDSFIDDDDSSNLSQARATEAPSHSTPARPDPPAPGDWPERSFSPPIASPALGDAPEIDLNDTLDLETTFPERESPAAPKIAKRKSGDLNLPGNGDATRAKRTKTANWNQGDDHVGQARGERRQGGGGGGQSEPGWEKGNKSPKATTEERREQVTEGKPGRRQSLGESPVTPAQGNKAQRRRQGESQNENSEQKVSKSQGRAGSEGRSQNRAQSKNQNHQSQNRTPAGLADVTTEEENSTQEDDLFETPLVKVQTKYQRKKRSSLERSEETKFELQRFSLFKEAHNEKKGHESSPRGKHSTPKAPQPAGPEESPSALKQQKLYFDEVDKRDLTEATEEEMRDDELSRQVRTLPGPNSVAYKRYLEYVEGMKELAEPFSFEEFLAANRDLDWLFS